MLRGFAAKKARREEEERVTSERWQSLLKLFELQFDEAGVSLEGLIHHHHLSSPESDAHWQVWWERDKEESQLARLAAGLQERYVPPIAVYGSNNAGPAEWQSIELISNAAAKSKTTLLAAILLTTLRASDAGHRYDPSKEARETMRFVRDQAYRALERQGIDPYSTAKSWFLPERFRLIGSPQTAEEMVGQLGSIMSDFLARWVPVKLTVELRDPHEE